MESKRTIGALARAAGINVETVRYYERRGLIRQPGPSATGWRHYDDEVLRRVRFIKRAQQLGFSLDDLEHMLSLRSTRSEARCDQVRQAARERLAEVDRKLDDLVAMRDALKELIDACADNVPGECPLLSALEKRSPELSTDLN